MFYFFCCTLLCVRSSIAIILMGKRELVALLNLSSWCLVMVERLFLAVPQGCLRFVIVVFPDHTHLLFLIEFYQTNHQILYQKKNQKLLELSNGKKSAYSVAKTLQPISFMYNTIILFEIYYFMIFLL